MQSQKDTPLYDTPVLTLKAIAEKMNVMDKEVINFVLQNKIFGLSLINIVLQVKVLVNKAKLARTKRLKELAEKLKEFDKKLNETTNEEAKEESSEKKEKEADGAKEEEKPADDKPSDSLEGDHVEL